MLIDKNIFSVPKNIHHKKSTSWKITLQVNKSKTKFDTLIFKFLETLKTNVQASSETLYCWSCKILFWPLRSFASKV